LLALTPAPAFPAAELGSVRFESSGAAEAQEAFQQGVAALHSFFYGEAARQFREAQEADPGFALAYWGEALTHNHPLWREQDREAARAVLERLAPTAAERAAKAPTERERAYLEAVETLFGEGSKEERDRAYAEALRRLHEGFPADPEAAAFYALALQGADVTGPGVIPARMRSAAILEELFDDHPDHPGVLHYLIHAYDDPVHAPLGLRAARRYARVAPAAHHARHMPSHIFLQLGLWEEVVASNRDAVAASEAWVERRGLAADQIDLHSLTWLHYGLLQLGRLREAEEVLHRAEAVVEQVGTPRAVHHRDDMRARHGLETGSAETVLLPPLPEATAHHGVLLEAAAQAAYRRGDGAVLGAVAERLAALAAEEGGAPSLAAAARQAEGLRHLQRGEPEAGIARLREAAGLEEALDPPSGPPGPAKPSHELLGEVLLARGQAEDAAGAFAAALARMPNRAASLAGAARAAAAVGEAARARELAARLLGQWSGADEDFPPLVRWRAEGTGEALEAR
jgi:tetratricopeptide (TPR) repeat protein